MVPRRQLRQHDEWEHAQPLIEVRQVDRKVLYAAIHRAHGIERLFVLPPADVTHEALIVRSGRGPRTLHGTERGALHYGDEIDAQLQARRRRFSALMKYADYHADGFLTDTRKLWVQLEYVW